MTTETQEKIDVDAPAVWPPVAHLVHARNHPPKEGDLALCGAKLMGIDLENMGVKKVCKKCEEIARRS